MVSDVIFVGDPWCSDHELLLGLGRVLLEDLPGKNQEDTERGVRLLGELAADATAVPLTEEWVLACAFHNRLRPDGLRLHSALCAVDRLMQRTELPRHLNPSWDVLGGIEPLVIKARASTMSDGVTFTTGPAVTRLAAVTELGPGSMLIEQDLPGPQFEINAIVGWMGDVIHTFPALEQEWSANRREIVRYRRAAKIDHDLGVHILDQAIAALGLAGCGVNLEYRAGRVIEVQARLGEDPRPEYNALLEVDDPSAQLIRKLLADRKGAR